MGMVAVFVPAVAVSIMLPSHPLRHFLRGGEAAVCLAMTIDGARRLMQIGSGVQVTIPGNVWAVINVTMLAAVALFPWARVGQVVRHNARYRNQVKVWRTIREQGVDDPTIQEGKG